MARWARGRDPILQRYGVGGLARLAGGGAFEAVQRSGGLDALVRALACADPQTQCFAAGALGAWPPSHLLGLQSCMHVSCTAHLQPLSGGCSRGRGWARRCADPRTQRLAAGALNASTAGKRFICGVGLDVLVQAGCLAAGCIIARPPGCPSRMPSVLICFRLPSHCNPDAPAS